MKTFTRLVTVLVTLIVSLHYYCEINGCPDQLTDICTLTNPIVWNVHLSKENEYYKETISPYVVNIHQKYSTVVKPQVISYINDITVYSAPVVQKAATLYKDLDVQSYVLIASQHIKILKNKVCFFHHTTLKPLLSPVKDQLHSDEVCEKFHARINPVLEKANIPKYCQFLRNYIEVTKHRFSEFVSTLQLKFSSFNEKDIKDAISKEVKNFVEKSEKVVETTTTSDVEEAATSSTTSSTEEEVIETTTTSDVEEATTSSTTSSTEEEEVIETTTTSTINEVIEITASTNDVKVEEEDDDEGPTTITSTLSKTITMEISAQFTEDAEIEIVDLSDFERPDENAPIEEKIAAWNKMIDAKLKFYLGRFNESADTLKQRKIKELKPKIQREAKLLGEILRDSQTKLNFIIEDIKATKMFDEETNKEVYFNSEGTKKIERYITRRYVRLVIEEFRAIFKSASDDFYFYLNDLVKGTSNDVDISRNIILAEYDEWCKATIQEWDQTMASLYGEDFNQVDASDEEKKIWRKFIRTKRRAVSKGILITKATDDREDINDYVSGYADAVQEYSNVFGESLYIIRSRANLAFQEREKTVGDDAEMEALDAELEDSVQARKEETK